MQSNTKVMVDGWVNKTQQTVNKLTCSVIEYSLSNKQKFIEQ